MTVGEITYFNRPAEASLDAMHARIPTGPTWVGPPVGSEYEWREGSSHLPTPGNLALHMPMRPAIVQIQETADLGEAQVAVTLSWHQGSFSGRAIGDPDARARPRLVGEATLRAIEAVSGGRIELTLSAVATVTLGEGQVAMAQVKIAGAPDPLVGSAMLDDRDPAAAVVRAVLDALNRKLGQVL